MCADFTIRFYFPGIVPKEVNYLINEIAEIRSCLSRFSLNQGLELTSTGLSALKMLAGFWIRQKTGCLNYC